MSESEVNVLSGRLQVPALNALLGEPFRVLNDGFVRVVDYMGGDSAIVQAARVSYGAGTKRIEEDSGLIRYLMRHGHTSPLEMCEIKLHIRVPMDCWRQWIRHRTANVNEYSTRYSVAINAAQVTDESEWRRQSQTNRQGGAAPIERSMGSKLSAREAELQHLSREVYEERLSAGVAREQARKDLPLSTYTEAYWKIDLHNLLNFLRLRMDSHAQAEIREYARIIGEKIVAPWCPVTWQAFLDYQINAVQLTELEATVVKLLATGDGRSALAEVENRGLLKRTNGVLTRNRERTELEGTLDRLGFTIPWLPSGEGLDPS